MEAEDSGQSQSDYAVQTGWQGHARLILLRLTEQCGIHGLAGPCKIVLHNTSQFSSLPVAPLSLTHQNAHLLAEYAPQIHGMLCIRPKLRARPRRCHASYNMPSSPRQNGMKDVSH